MFRPAAVTGLSLTLLMMWLGSTANAWTIPCEGRDVAPNSQKTCGTCSGACPYPNDDPCLDTKLGSPGLSCKAEACEELPPVPGRCAAIASDHYDPNNPSDTVTPNILIVVTDDWGWQLYENLDAREDLESSDGRFFSAFNEYYKPRRCIGGADDNKACGKNQNCQGTDFKCHDLELVCDGTDKDEAGEICRPEEPADCGQGTCNVPCSALDDGCHQNELQTPTLDSLARSGAFFPVAHLSASKCIPSITSLLTGRYGKDMRMVSSVEAGNATIPLLLRNRNTHCSLKLGKTWSGRLDVNSEECTECGDDCIDCGDPKAGFHYSVTDELGIDFKDVGRDQHTLETATCIVRAMNKDDKPFLVWYVPYLPHDPSGAPAGFKDCYDDDTFVPAAMGRIDGGSESFPSSTKLSQHSWGDCVIGAMLDFLKTTPDERFCPEGAPCDACKRLCDPQGPPSLEQCTCNPTPCSDDTDCTGTPGSCVAGFCADRGLCNSEIPCLADTTVIFYASDNGSPWVFNGKGRFTDNGYRTPLIMSYGNLGGLRPAERPADLASMPPPLQPYMHTEMAHALDVLPTILDYADADPSIPNDERCERHRGRSLKALGEDPATGLGRTYLFGHKNVSNSGQAVVTGTRPHYVRTGKWTCRDQDALIGGCSVKGDCTGLPSPAQPGCPDPAAGELLCINRVCTRECADDSDCPGFVPCINGACGYGNECKLYNTPGNPGRCTPKLYNLGYDPGETVNLSGKSGSQPTDPGELCIGEEQRLQCELVRWCLEDCLTDGDPGFEDEIIECRDCCVDRCNDCAKVANGACDTSHPEFENFFEIPGSGSGAGCWDCRTPCESCAPGDCEDCPPGVDCVEFTTSAGTFKKCDTTVARRGNCQS